MIFFLKVLFFDLWKNHLSHRVCNLHSAFKSPGCFYYPPVPAPPILISLIWSGNRAPGFVNCSPARGQLECRASATGSMSSRIPSMPNQVDGSLDLRTP